MASIFDTIKYWADGQNALNAAPPERARELQRVAVLAVQRLQRQGCLADLAAAYYSDGAWWPHLAQEFALSAEDAGVARGAAYWQRFMEIRHPTARAART